MPSQRENSTSPSPRFAWLRRIAFLAVGIALVAIAWNYSACDPAFRDSKSPWIPLAFSPDGKILAAADLTEARKWEDGNLGPSGPIHLLRAADLAPAGPPVETPMVAGPQVAFHPLLQSVEFSPNGELLAILQKHHEFLGSEQPMFELLLIRLPKAEIWKAFNIPYRGFQARDRVARRFFSADGRLLAWYEFDRSADRHLVRVWDVTEGRERFAAEAVAYPALSPDGRWLAAIEQNTPGQRNDIACRLYDVSNGQVVHSLLLPGDDAGWQPWPEFSEDGRLLVVNSGSSQGKSPSVVVFDVASGKDVFRAAEWSSHFLGGSTLVTVKDDAVRFRAADTWQVRAEAKFALGRHWDNGGELRPEPMPVPGRAAVIVYDYYPSPSNRLGDLRRSLRLEPEPGHRASWVDATTGAVTPFAAHSGLVHRTAISPGGDRLAVQGLGMTVWELPPRRSWFPMALAAGLLAFIWGVWIVVRLWFKRRPRPVRDGHTF
jgi:WD40 repeat protein